MTEKSKQAIKSNIQKAFLQRLNKEIEEATGFDVPDLEESKNREEALEKIQYFRQQWLENYVIDLQRAAESVERKYFSFDERTS